MTGALAWQVTEFLNKNYSFLLRGEIARGFYCPGSLLWCVVSCCFGFLSFLWYISSIHLDRSPLHLIHRQSEPVDLYRAGFNSRGLKHDLHNWISEGSSKVSGFLEQGVWCLGLQFCEGS